MNFTLKKAKNMILVFVCLFFVAGVANGMEVKTLAFNNAEQDAEAICAELMARGHVKHEKLDQLLDWFEEEREGRFGYLEVVLWNLEGKPYEHNKDALFDAEKHRADVWYVLLNDLRFCFAAAFLLPASAWGKILEALGEEEILYRSFEVAFRMLWIVAPWLPEETKNVFREKVFSKRFGFFLKGYFATSHGAWTNSFYWCLLNRLAGTEFKEHEDSVLKIIKNRKAVKVLINEEMLITVRSGGNFSMCRSEEYLFGWYYASCEDFLNSFEAEELVPLFKIPVKFRYSLSSNYAPPIIGAVIESYFRRANFLLDYLERRLSPQQIKEILAATGSDGKTALQVAEEERVNMSIEKCKQLNVLIKRLKTYQ
jgi:hypothetical protein